MGYSITKSGIHNSTGNNNRNGGRSTNNSNHEMNGTALVTRPFCFHNLSNTTLQYADDSAMTAQRQKPIINSAEAGTISFGLGHLCRALGLCETCAARTLVSAHVPQGAAWPVLHTLCSTHVRRQAATNKQQASTFQILDPPALFVDSSVIADFTYFPRCAFAAWQCNTCPYDNHKTTHFLRLSDTPTRDCDSYNRF